MIKPPAYNILILVNVRWWNATAFYAVNIARILKKNGHRVIVAGREDYPAFTKARACGLEVLPLDFSGYNPFSLVENCFKMIRFVKQNNIQIINAHRSEDHTFAVLAKIVSCADVFLTRGDRRKISRSPLSSLKYRLCNGAIVTCRQIINKSRHIFDRLGEKTAVIYGSVDEDDFKPTRPAVETRKKYGLDLEKKIVGLVGRLSPVKDPVTFIEAAAHIVKRRSDVTFIIAGKEVEISKADLMHHVQEKNIRDHVVIFPHVDDIADIVHTFDVGVITSTGSETISRVLLEYMFLGKPVIGTRVNAIGEIIQPGLNGDLVEPGDAGDLAKKIDQLLSNDSLRASYGEQSFRLYQSEYSEKRFYLKTMEIFSDS